MGVYMYIREVFLYLLFFALGTLTILFSVFAVKTLG